MTNIAVVLSMITDQCLLWIIGLLWTNNLSSSQPGLVLSNENVSLVDIFYYIFFVLTITSILALLFR